METTQKMDTTHELDFLRKCRMKTLLQELIDRLSFTGEDLNKTQTTIELILRMQKSRIRSFEEVFKGDEE